MSYGSTGSGSHGSHGGSYSAGYGSHGGTIISEVPVDSMETQPADGTYYEEEGGIIDSEDLDVPVDSEARRREGLPTQARHLSPNRGLLMVSLPSNAKVFVNDNATKSTGSYRRYAAKELAVGKAYEYTVRAEIERNGQVIEETKTAIVQGGNITRLSFDLVEQVETSLTLQVPEDAKVILSGTETKASGQTRKFATSKIKKGAKWSDYKVQVVVNRNGKTITREKDVTLHGGDQLNLAFDFDDEAMKVASTR